MINTYHSMASFAKGGCKQRRQPPRDGRSRRRANREVHPEPPEHRPSNEDHFSPALPPASDSGTQGYRTPQPRPQPSSAMTDSAVEMPVTRRSPSGTRSQSVDVTISDNAAYFAEHLQDERAFADHHRQGFGEARAAGDGGGNGRAEFNCKTDVEDHGFAENPSAKVNDNSKPCPSPSNRHTRPQPSLLEPGSMQSPETVFGITPSRKVPPAPVDWPDESS